MSDPINWFLFKHWFISALLMPEIAFAFALWERWYFWAATVLVYILIGRAMRFSR